MVTGKPIDPIAAYDPDTCECVLADEYKGTIKDALPRGAQPTEAFWRELTDIVSKFRIAQKCRLARRAPAAEIKRWQRIAKLATTEGQRNANLAAVKNLAEA